MADPFAGLFADLTVGPGVTYADQPGPGIVPGQPVAPITAKDDAWGLVGASTEKSKASTFDAVGPGSPTSVSAPLSTPAAKASGPPPVHPLATQAVAAATPPPKVAAASSASPGLPEGWTAYTDPASGREYYHHTVTGQVTWEKPKPSETETAAAPDPLAVQSIHSFDSDGGVQAGPSETSAAGIPAEEDDFWAQMGFGVETVEEEEQAPTSKTETNDKGVSGNAVRRSKIRASIVRVPDQGLAHLAEDDAGADRLDDATGLPAGETLEVVLERFTFRLGAVFLTAREVKVNLYCKVCDEVIKRLGDRPVVAYVAGNAAAHKSGIQPGDILLKVGEEAATEPKRALELIESTPRPLKLALLRPDLPVILGENQHMVKYNNFKKTAPTNMRDWKAKYCVVGGMVGRPYALLMYYSKADYDRAVASNLAGRRHPDVKIKAFDLRGCKLVVDQTVHYPQNSRSWHFFMIQQPPGGAEDRGLPPNVIKISHPVKEGLIPILEAVRRVTKKYPTRPVITRVPEVGYH